MNDLVQAAEDERQAPFWLAHSQCSTAVLQEVFFLIVSYWFTSALYLLSSGIHNLFFWRSAQDNRVCVFKMKLRQCRFSQDSKITVYIRLLLNMPYYILQIHKIKRLTQSHAKGVQYLPQTRGQKIPARLPSFRWTITSAVCLERSAAISTQLFWKYRDSAALFALAPTGTLANGPDTARSSSFSWLIQLLALSYYTFYSTGCWGLSQGTRVFGGDLSKSTICLGIGDRSVLLGWRTELFPRCFLKPKCRTYLLTSGAASPKFWGGPKNGESKMFDFRRITLICLGYRFFKHKVTIYAKYWGHGPLTPPGCAYAPDLGNGWTLPNSQIWNHTSK